MADTKSPNQAADLLVSNYETCTGATLTFRSLIALNSTVSFTAFLTDFDQSFASNWTTEEVFGRMDPIASFRSTKRTLTLAWTIPASTKEEAKKNLEKVSHLTQMLYPAYDATEQKKADSAASENTKKKEEQGKKTQTTIKLATNAHTQTLSKPPLVKIKYANLLGGMDGNGQLGWIDGLSIRPSLDMGFFVDSKSMYPKVIQISCNFNVLHQQSVGHTQSGRWMGVDAFPFSTATKSGGGGGDK